MTIVVDQDGCISCGICVNTCPEVFCFNQDNKSAVCRQPEDEQAQQAAQEAADACPVSVIHVEP